MFFLETLQAIVFHTSCRFSKKLLDFGTTSKSSGANFRMSGTEKAPKATQWASKIWSFWSPPPGARLDPPEGYSDLTC